jgi:hypothetical protein
VRAAVLFGLVGAGALSACGAPQAGGPQPTAAAQLPVTLDGAAYLAELRPGAAGETVTAAGARPTRGLTVAVTRSGAPLHYSDGAAAKTVAERACADSGRRFNPAAIGRVTGAGVWSFAGACA